MASGPVASVAIAATKSMEDLTSYAMTLSHQHLQVRETYCPIVRIFLPLCSDAIADIGIKRADCIISLGGLGGGIATSPGPTSSLSMSILLDFAKSCLHIIQIDLRPNSGILHDDCTCLRQNIQPLTSLIQPQTSNTSTPTSCLGVVLY